MGKDTWEATIYRTYIGPYYVVMGVHQLSLLVKYGLREEHTLLDVGCGSLRAGRFFMMYLENGNYFGLEPHKWLVDEAIEKEVSMGLVRLKEPTFWYVGDFEMPSDARFDFVVCNSVFSHAPIEQVRQCFRSVAKHLNPGGKFLFTFVDGYADYKGASWVYPPTIPGCIAYRFDTIEKETRKVFSSFEWLLDEHPNGQQWVMVTR